MIKIRRSYLLFLILIFLFCSVSYAQDSSEPTTEERVAALEAIVSQLSSGQENIQEMLQQTILRLNQLKEHVTVLTAFSSYNSINNNLDKLLLTEVAIDAQLNLANAQMDANWEAIEDGVISFIESIQLDPAGIITTSASTAIILTFDVGDVIDLSSAVSKLNTAKENITAAIAEYQREVSDRENYYNTLKRAYEQKHGEFDPDAPPVVPPISFCARGQACQQKPGNHRDPEAHQRPCPDKVEGVIRERGCTGHVYFCDPDYLCIRWNDHMIDGTTGCKHKRYSRGEKEKHQMLMPGPCHDDHNYYACNNKGHEFVATGRCREKKSASVWNPYGDHYEHVYVKCIKQSSYYKCKPHTHKYPTHRGAFAYYYY